MKSRNTVQRQLVHETVGRLADHPTAEEVYNCLHEDHPNISKGTVYRNLGYLSENGELRRIAVPGSADRFDHHTIPHYHIQCVCCGMFCDIDTPYLSQIDAKVEQATGFSCEKHDIVFQGVCPACKEKSE
ncbi:Fur family transcriptional regulator [Candidatus Soleaferrea massiliensis]|uniref:Fur family transcriptional regulator n=1 Tax=Candidatus Soleaferrea massiliensis TaxID=1470354 RepID=UPI00058F5292|nr:transcriptional repressor [Candidatus Soleaferrea massiliensis]